MNDIDSLTNKDFTNSANITKDQNLKELATVTLCLCDHDKCTGQYVDYTKTYVVKCACSCHNNYYNSGLKGDK
jgi:hypothetical protein